MIGEIKVILLDGNKTAEVLIEEWIGYEPSAYQHEEGWTAFDLNSDKEYFISLDGEVYEMPYNKVVGICPEIKEEYARRDPDNGL